jgi:8-oxo-dGTP pyrophosphatase MutT (NUDIX family)
MKNRHDGIATPYTAVYLIFEQDGKIAFLLRSNTGWMNGYYSLPSGRVEKGESFLQAAIREGAEEVGVQLRPDDLELATTAHRSETDSLWVDLIFKVKQWEGELYNAEPHIHGELAQLDPNNLPENIVPSVRYYVEEYLKGNRYTEYGFDR